MEGSSPEVMYLPYERSSYTVCGDFLKQNGNKMFRSPIREWPLAAQLYWKSYSNDSLVG